MMPYVYGRMEYWTEWHKVLNITYLKTIYEPDASCPLCQSAGLHCSNCICWKFLTDNSDLVEYHDGIQPCSYIMGYVYHDSEWTFEEGRKVRPVILLGIGWINGKIWRLENE